MTKCKEKCANFCDNACCYIPIKELTEQEATYLGSSNYIKEDGIYRLKNSPVSGACVFLDIKLKQCSIYNTPRFKVCRDYSCDIDVSRIVNLILAVKKQDIELNNRILEELRANARNYYPDMGEDEAVELMYPGVFSEN